MFRFSFIFLMCFTVQSLFAQLKASYSSESYRTETHPFRDFLATTSYSVSDEGNKELYIVQNLKAGTPRSTLSANFSIDKYDKSGKLLITKKFDVSEKDVLVGIEGLVPTREKLFLCLVKYGENDKTITISLNELDKNTLELKGNSIIVMSLKNTSKYCSLAMDVVQSPNQSSLAVVYYPLSIKGSKIKATSYFFDASGNPKSSVSFNCNDYYAQEFNGIVLSNNGNLYLSYIHNSAGSNYAAMMQNSKTSTTLIDYKFELIGINSTSKTSYNYLAVDKNIQLLSPRVSIDQNNNVHLGSIVLKKTPYESGLYKEVLSADLKSLNTSFTKEKLIYKPTSKGADQNYLMNYTFDQVVLNDGESFFIYEITTQENSNVAHDPSDVRTRTIDNHFEINVLPYTSSFSALSPKVYPKYQRTEGKYTSIASYIVLNKGTEAYVLYNGRKDAFDDEEKFKMNFSTKSDIKYIKLAEESDPVKVLPSPDDQTKISTRLKGGSFFILNSEWESKIMFLE